MTIGAGRSQCPALIEEVRRQGATTLGEIAAALAARQVPTPRGGEWTATAVKRVLDRQAEAG